MPQIHARLTLLNHLLHWNALINISAVTEPEEMSTIHIVDSLEAQPRVVPLPDGIAAPARFGKTSASAAPSTPIERNRQSKAPYCAK